jgi:hypothetical protein
MPVTKIIPFSFVNDKEVWIGGSHSSGYEERILLGCNTVLFGDRTTFSMNISPPSLGLMNKQETGKGRQQAGFLIALLFNLEDGSSIFF